MSVSPAPGLAEFDGGGFSFDYPDTWTVFETYGHCGMNGPTIFAALGIGGYDNNWRERPNFTSCGPAKWTVPDDGIVLAYYIEPNIGYTSYPTPWPGQEWIAVGSRQGIYSEQGGSIKVRLPGLPEYIEVRWGPAMADRAPNIVDQLIATWQWKGDQQWWWFPSPSPSTH